MKSGTVRPRAAPGPSILPRSTRRRKPELTRRLAHDLPVHGARSLHSAARPSPDLSRVLGVRLAGQLDGHRRGGPRLLPRAIPLFAWPAAFMLVLVTVAFIVAFRWLVLPRVTEGTYSIWSGFYLRKWAVALATEVTLETLSSLFATLYMRTWYRTDGREDRQGFGNLDQSLRPLRSRRNRRQMLHRR